MKLLVSVRSVAEARIAAAGGADYIDCKEPRAGALGALPLETIRAIVDALPGHLVSATVGDFAPQAIDPVLERAAATAACGVDLVKVGIAAGASALLEALAEVDAAVVPVFIADQGLDWDLLARACGLPFAAVMLDTQDKASGSLFDVASEPTLRRFVAAARAARTPCGLAGALRVAHLPRLRALAPDFAGFRSAVCAGARDNALDASRLALLRTALAAADRPQTDTTIMLAPPLGAGRGEPSAQDKALGGCVPAAS